MAKKKVRLTDIAQACNVSISTVSRALQGNPQIAAETREQIIAEAMRREYRSPQIALANAAQKRPAGPRVVGKKLAVIEHGDNIRSFFSEALREISITSAQRGLETCFVPAEIKESLAECLRKASATSPDVIILISWANLTEADARQLSQTGVPVIIFNRYIAGCCNAVTLDDFSAGVHIARYLHSLGHRRIAHLCGLQSASSVRDRADGIRSELLRLSCYDPDLICQLDVCHIVDSINTWIKRLLDMPEPCTAIWAYNDAAAALVYAAVRAVGLAVPGDISIAGFDYMVQVRELNLTTFDYRQAEMGRVAVTIAADLLTGAIHGPLRACVIPEFVAGATTGPARRRLTTSPR